MNESVEPPATGLENKKSWRPLVLVISLATGALTFVGSVLFLFIGAGMYGSPLAGDVWFNTTLFLIVLFGPMAVLPCALVEKWWPTWGGVALCNLSIPVVFLLILNNMREWGFATYDAATGTLCLAIPMFILGTLLWHSQTTHEKWAKIVWRTQLMMLAGFLLSFAGAIAVDELQLFQHPQPAEP
jgi:hypothetical protein